MKNKNHESGVAPTTSINHTSLGDIPELSFTKSDADIEVQNRIHLEESKHISGQKSEKRVFIVNRNKETPMSDQESRLLCTEDLDMGLISHDKGSKYKNEFNSILNPE